MEKSKSTPEKEIVEVEAAIISQKVIKMIEEEGAYKVAKKMNVPQAKFQHLKNGGGLSLNTIVGLSKAIKIDWNSMIYGSDTDDLVDTPQVMTESEKDKEIELLREQLKDHEELKKNLLKAEGKIESYQEMMSGIIKFRPTLEEEEIKEKIKASGFNPAHEEARVIALNFDENTENYYPEYVEPGFKPNWMHNAS